MQMPEQTTFCCPHCNVVSVHGRNGSAEDYTETIVLKGKGGKSHQATVAMEHRIYRCANCRKDTYFLFRGHATAISASRPGAGFATIVAQAPPELIHQYPVSTPILHASVNDDVKSATTEAESCFSVRAYNACGVMTRRAMHSLCDDKGAKGKDLFEKLRYLREHNLITPDLWDWAEELRIAGRSGAHPDWEEVSKEDAEYALKFLREIIRYVYINPAERAARRLKETKRKKKK